MSKSLLPLFCLPSFSPFDPKRSKTFFGSAEKRASIFFGDEEIIPRPHLTHPRESTRHVCGGDRGEGGRETLQEIANLPLRRGCSPPLCCAEASSLPHSERGGKEGKSLLIKVPLLLRIPTPPPPPPHLAFKLLFCHRERLLLLLLLLTSLSFCTWHKMKEGQMEPFDNYMTFRTILVAISFRHFSCRKTNGSNCFVRCTINC